MSLCVGGGWIEKIRIRWIDIILIVLTSLALTSAPLLSRACTLSTLASLAALRKGLVSLLLSLLPIFANGK